MSKREENERRRGKVGWMESEEERRMDRGRGRRKKCAIK